MPTGVYKRTEKTKKRMSKAVLKRHQNNEKFGFQKGQHVSLKTEFKRGHKPIAGFKKGHKPICPFKKGYQFWLGKKRPNISGKNHPFWKGGKTTNYSGYIYIEQSKHPFAHNGYIKRSRFVMEKHIGRYLLPEEVVHHINSIKNDDRLENLQLFTNQSEHMKFHRSLDSQDVAIYIR